MERKFALRTFLFFLIACHVTTANENHGLVARAFSTLRSYYDAVVRWAQECALKASAKHTVSEFISTTKCVGSQLTFQAALQLVVSKFTGNHQEKWRLLCNLKDEVLPCFKPLYQNGFRCLMTSEERTSWDTFALTVNSTLAFVCHPKTERIMAPNESQSLSCMDELDLPSCITENVSAKDVIKYLTNFGALKCKKQDAIYNCLMNQLNRCEDDEAHHLINDVLEKLFNTPCNSAVTLTCFPAWLFTSFVAMMATKSYYL